MSARATDTDSIRLYISATPDLELEREMLAKAIIEIPTSLGWHLGQTPKGDMEVDLDAVAQADLHVLILGSDIKAPVGLEWQTARRWGRLPILFEKDTAHTQAADAFRRELSRAAEWHPYQALADLRRHVLDHIVRHLLAHSDDYSLPINELERLQQWQKGLRKPSKSSAKANDPIHGGADASAIILSEERFTPSQGKLITGK